MPAYDVLINGCQKLGKIATQVINSAASTSLGPLRRPHGGGSGEFTGPNYFGEVMTPNRNKPNVAHTILWCGVLAKPAYGIEPTTKGIPELSVGIAFWGERSSLSEDAKDQIEKIAEKLRQNTLNMVWRCDIVAYANRTPNVIGFVRTDLSFINLYQQVGSNFWDQDAQNFLETALGAIKLLDAADIQRFLDCFK